MPGKRTRRHFSQLSEFERGLIIGMKTEGWSTHRVSGQVDRSECAVRNCWEQWTREVTRSTIRADVGVAIVPQTISIHLAEANLKSKRPFRALPLTPEHRQLRLQWCQGDRLVSQIGKMLCLVMKPGSFWGQMITVYACGGNLLYTNALPSTWRKLYGHSSPRGAGVDRHALTSPSIVHYQFFELFGALRSTSSKLASLVHRADIIVFLCTRAPIA
ncbi:HTH_Tnp_Tc3_2 domain-containing protein [Trichonephila clavipes]|nr:HTH_Tnp_Tc3_2 domain-containing protein [Trichonephila clavipes]